MQSSGRAGRRYRPITVIKELQGRRAADRTNMLAQLLMIARWNRSNLIKKTVYFLVPEKLLLLYVKGVSCYQQSGSDYSWHRLGSNCSRVKWVFFKYRQQNSWIFPNLWANRCRIKPGLYHSIFFPRLSRCKAGLAIMHRGQLLQAVTTPWALRAFTCPLDVLIWECALWSTKVVGGL